MRNRIVLAVAKVWAISQNNMVTVLVESTVHKVILEELKRCVERQDYHKLKITTCYFTTLKELHHQAPAHDNYRSPFPLNLVNAMGGRLSPNTLATLKRRHLNLVIIDFDDMFSPPAARMSRQRNNEYRLAKFQQTRIPKHIVKQTFELAKELKTASIQENLHS
jgi:hypothetical protein